MRDTLPPPSYSEFNERVRCLAALYPLSVSSGIRSHRHNKEVGGGENSWHRIERGGIATDVVLDNMSYDHRFVFCTQARKLGMDAVDETDHIHLEPSDQ